MATDVRGRFLVAESSVDEVVMLGSEEQASLNEAREARLRRNYTRLKAMREPVERNIGFEGQFRKLNKTLLRKADLTSQQIQAIVSEWRSNKPDRAALARMFGISTALAQRIIRQYKADPDELDVRAMKESSKLTKIEAIRVAVSQLLADGRPIWTSS